MSSRTTCGRSSVKLGKLLDTVSRLFRSITNSLLKLLGYHCRRELWWSGNGLSSTLCRSRRDQSSVWFISDYVEQCLNTLLTYTREHWSIIRSALSIMHQPALAKRNTSTERTIPPRINIRREDWRISHVRTLRGIGRREHEDHSREEGGRLRAQRKQDVDHKCMLSTRNHKAT